MTTSSSDRVRTRSSTPLSARTPATSTRRCTSDAAAVRGSVATTPRVRRSRSRPRSSSCPMPSTIRTTHSLGWPSRASGARSVRGRSAVRPAQRPRTAGPPPSTGTTGCARASVAVPGGTDTDTQLIRTFCNVVGWGSARYIALQQNPLPTILMATVAVGGGRRGRPPNGLGRRRAVPLSPVVGDSARSSGLPPRLYRERPFRFVEIGLVHLPVSILVGVVVILVQLLAMAMTPVEADGELGPIGLVVTAAVAGAGPSHRLRDRHRHRFRAAR